MSCNRLQIRRLHPASCAAPYRCDSDKLLQAVKAEHFKGTVGVLDEKEINYLARLLSTCVRQMLAKPKEETTDQDLANCRECLLNIPKHMTQDHSNCQRCVRQTVPQDRHAEGSLAAQPSAHAASQGVWHLAL